jgi:hypothetical protein
LPKSKKMFDFLTDPLPGDYVSKSGRTYTFNTSFRCPLLFLRHTDWTEDQRNDNALSMFFPKGFPDEGDAIGNYIAWFISGGIENDEKTSSGQRSFDFCEDSGKIVASFWQDYKIDLTDKNLSLHWFVFLELFKGLKLDTFIRRVISIRTEKENTGKNYAEYNRDLRKLKAIYALTQKESDGYDAFSGL